MPKTDKLKPAASRTLKRAHHRAKKAGDTSSLKEFVKNSDNEKVVQARDNWFFNKKANTKKAPLGLGNTRKKKNKH